MVRDKIREHKHLHVRSDSKDMNLSCEPTSLTKGSLFDRTTSVNYAADTTDLIDEAFIV